MNWYKISGSEEWWEKAFYSKDSGYPEGNIFINVIGAEGLFCLMEVLYILQILIFQNTKKENRLEMR